MTIDTLIILSGASVAILPFLGFPNSWDTALFFILGVAIVGLGMVVRRRLGNTRKSGGNGDVYVENRPRFEDVHEEV